MKSPSLVLVALLFSFTRSAVGDSTKTFQTCLTKKGTASVAKVPSTTYGLTVTKTATQVVTSTPSRIVIPAPSTTILTSIETDMTTTTLSQITDTYTDTITVTETQTTTETAATTTITEQTSVTTTLSPTSAVPAPAGFTGLVDQLPGAAKKRSPKVHIDARAALPTNKPYCKISNGKVTYYPAMYPRAVTCAQLVKITKTSTKMFTATSTKTITAATPIITSSTTQTTTMIQTSSLIDASTTITEMATTTTTTTSTITPSTTTTITTTITASQPTATVYAQCAPNNLLTSFNGRGISAISGVDTNEFDTSASSPTECCNICASTSLCGGYLYANGYCAIYTPANGLCATGQQYGLSFFSGGLPSSSIVIGNGQCGSYGYSGSLGS